MGCLGRWRVFGAGKPAAAHPLNHTSTLVGDEDIEDDATVEAMGRKLLGERDSWLNKGTHRTSASGAQWNGALPGPGPDALPAVPRGPRALSTRSHVNP